MAAKNLSTVQVTAWSEPISTSLKDLQGELGKINDTILGLALIVESEDARLAEEWRSFGRNCYNGKAALQKQTTVFETFVTKFTKDTEKNEQKVTGAQDKEIEKFNDINEKLRDLAN